MSQNVVERWRIEPFSAAPDYVHNTARYMGSVMSPGWSVSPVATPHRMVAVVDGSVIRHLTAPAPAKTILAMMAFRVSLVKALLFYRRK